MTWLNEDEIDSLPRWIAAVADRQGTDLSNLLHLAECLRRYKNWVNANSDGWPYWSAGTKPAARLCEELSGVKRTFYSGRDVHDVMQADVTRHLRWMRKFLRARDVDPDTVAPLRPIYGTKETGPVDAVRWGRVEHHAQEIAALTGASTAEVMSVIKRMMYA